MDPKTNKMQGAIPQNNADVTTSQLPSSEKSDVSKKTPRSNPNSNTNGKDKDDRNGKAANSRNNKKGKGGSKPARRNHYTWYTYDENMLKDVASFPYGYQVGREYRQSNTELLLIPGVQVVNYCPNFGISTFGDSSPIDIAKRRLNTVVRSSNSRTASYDSDDLIISHLAVLQCYAYAAALMRPFGTRRMFSYKNTFLPKFLIELMGFDYDDFITHNADYRARFNQLMVLLATLKAPKGMTILDRWTYLNGNVFTDSNSTKTQYTIYKPDHVYKWDATSYETGSALKAVSVTVGNNFGDKLDILEDMITTLLDDADVQAMQNDLAHAFQDSECLVPFGITDSFAIEPIADPNIETQLRSATVCCCFIDCVKQETAGGRLVIEAYVDAGRVQPDVAIPAFSNLGGAPLFALAPKMEPQDTIVAMVDMALITHGTGTGQGSNIPVDIGTAGPEIITGILMYDKPEFPTDGAYLPEMIDNEHVLCEGYVYGDSAMAYWAARSQAFNFTPYVTLVFPDNQSGAGAASYNKRYISRMENAILLGQKDITEVHNAMWYKLLHIDYKQFSKTKS